LCRPELPGSPVLPIRIANPKISPGALKPAAERPAMISRPIAAPIHASILKSKNYDSVNLRLYLCNFVCGAFRTAGIFGGGQVVKTPPAPENIEMARGQA